MEPAAGGPASSPRAADPDGALVNTEPMQRVSVSHDTAASVIEDPDRASLKRIAWAYGCAKKGSDEERMLRTILLERARREP